MSDNLQSFNCAPTTMTISSDNRKAGPFDGNDVATTFPFDFTLFSTTDLLVVHTDSAGAETTLIEGPDYVATLNPDQNASPGGSVTLSAPLPSGKKLTITSALAYLQTLDLTNQGGFYPNVIETALDKITIQIQQIAEESKRSLRLGIGNVDGQASYRAGGNRIQDIGAPIATTDVARKQDIIESLSGLATDGSGQFVVERLADAVDPVNGAAMVGLTQGGTVADAVSWVTPEMFGATGDGQHDDTSSVQAAIDYAGIHGMYVRADNHYLVSAVPASKHAVVVSSGVMLVGCGTFERDPNSEVPYSSMSVISIGTVHVPASNVTIDGIHVIAHHSQVPSGKYVQGIGARQDGAALNLTSHDVTIRNCIVEDVNVGIHCSKNTDANYGSAPRMSSQFYNWSVVGNTITNATNKAIEFDEATRSIASGNICSRVTDGLQVIHGCSNVSFVGNSVWYYSTGINITHEARNIVVSGNILTAQSTTSKAAIILRNEPLANVPAIVGVSIVGNTCIDSLSASGTLFALENRAETTGVSQILQVTLSGNTLNRNVRLYDLSGLNKFEIRDWTISGNTIGALVTTPKTQDNVTGILLSGNYINDMSALNADAFMLFSNYIKSTVTVAAGATGNSFIGNRTGAFTNNGTNTKINQLSNEQQATLYTLDVFTVTYAGEDPKTVNLPKTYFGQPYVMAQVSTTAGDRNASVSAVTTSKFDLRVYRSGSLSPSESATVFVFGAVKS